VLLNVPVFFGLASWMRWRCRPLRPGGGVSPDGVRDRRARVARRVSGIFLILAQAPVGVHATAQGAAVTVVFVMMAPH